jgi:hypothetical protein
MLTKDQILSSDDLPRELVKVPEWGGEVYVRTMSGADRDAFEADFQRDRSKDIRAKLAVRVVCDRSGQRLFTDADIPALSNKSAAALDRIFAAAIKLNKISKDDVEELKNA